MTCPLTCIKICGLSDVDMINAAIDHGATHIGFMHFPNSPRHVSIARMEELAIAARPVRRVLVLVDPDDDMLDYCNSSLAVDALQLHGSESPARVKQITERFSGPVWKVISVENEADIRRATDYQHLVERILFDAKTPKGAKLPGGMGVSFDWSLLKRLEINTLWGLSGGLDPDNVERALLSTGAPLVDVSSGVESQRGRKDMDKIARFCQAVRCHDTKYTYRPAQQLANPA